MSLPPTFWGWCTFKTRTTAGDIACWRHFSSGGRGRDPLASMPLTAGAKQAPEKGRRARGPRVPAPHAVLEVGPTPRAGLNPGGSCQPCSWMGRDVRQLRNGSPSKRRWEGRRGRGRGSEGGRHAAPAPPRPVRLPLGRELFLRLRLPLVPRPAPTSRRPLARSRIVLECWEHG